MHGKSIKAIKNPLSNYHRRRSHSRLARVSVSGRRSALCVCECAELRKRALDGSGHNGSLGIFAVVVVME
jgi:hypothetical protein